MRDSNLSYEYSGPAGVGGLTENVRFMFSMSPFNRRMLLEVAVLVRASDPNWFRTRGPQGVPATRPIGGGGTVGPCLVSLDRAGQRVWIGEHQKIPLQEHNVLLLEATAASGELHVFRRAKIDADLGVVTDPASSQPPAWPDGGGFIRELQRRLTASPEIVEFLA